MSSQPHKCPICEHEFSLESNAQWVICPSCGHQQSSAVFPDDADFLGALVDQGEDSQTLIETDNHGDQESYGGAAEFGDQTAVVATDHLERPADDAPLSHQSLDVDLPPAPSSNYAAATGIDLPETPQGEDIDMDFFEPGTGAAPNIASTGLATKKQPQHDPQTRTRSLKPKSPPPIPEIPTKPAPESAPPRTPIADGATVLPNLGPPSFLGPMVPDLSVPVAPPHGPPPLPAGAVPATEKSGQQALAKIALKPGGLRKRVTKKVEDDLPSLADYDSQSVYDLPPPGPPSILNDSGVSVYVPEAPVIEHRGGDQPFFQGKRERLSKIDSQVPALQPIKVRKPSTSVTAIKPGIRVRGNRTWLIVLGTAAVLAALAVGLVVALKL